MLRACVVLAIALLSSRVASAQLSQLTLVLQIDSDASGISLSGSGTSAASMLFGNVRAYGGTVPSGVTETLGASSLTLATKVDVNVSKGSLDVLDTLSTSYTLSAALQAADAQNTWTLNATTLSTSTVTITSAGVYASTPSYNFTLKIPFSAPAGAIANTLQLTAVAN